MKYLKTDLALLSAILLGLSLMVYAGEPIKASHTLSDSPAVHRAVH